MQQMIVIFVLFLYVAFSFNPLTELSLFSKTLLLSPGDMLTVFLVVGIFFKSLFSKRKSKTIRRPPVVTQFLLAFILLAVVFFVPTLLFFLLHNELADNLLKSLFWYFRWSIALILFYYSSDSSLHFADLRLLVKILLMTFFVAVMVNVSIASSEFSLLTLVTRTFSSEYMRLEGQIPDPNQLGELAAFFTVIGIMGTLHETKFGSKLIFLLLTGGTGLVMLLTQSRESILTLLVAVLGIILLLMRTKQFYKAIIVLFGLVLGSAYIAMYIPRIVETLSTIGMGEASYALSSRDETWRAAVDIIFTYPFGIGFEHFSYLTADVYWQAHNAFLQAAVVAGGFGLFAYTGYVCLLFRLLWERGEQLPQNWLIDAYFVFLLGYMATSMVSDHFITFYTFNAIFFGLLGFVACSKEEPYSLRKSGGNT